MRFVKSLIQVRNYSKSVQIKHGNTHYNLITYSVPENQNYVILESLNSIKENQYPLSIHVLMFTEEDSFLLVCVIL